MKKGQGPHVSGAARRSTGLSHGLSSLPRSMSTWKGRLLSLGRALERPSRLTLLPGGRSRPTLLPFLPLRHPRVPHCPRPLFHSKRPRRRPWRLSTSLRQGGAGWRRGPAGPDMDTRRRKDATRSRGASDAGGRGGDAGAQGRGGAGRGPTPRRPLGRLAARASTGRRSSYRFQGLDLLWKDVRVGRGVDRGP